MEKEFVPYEQALALKELGFDEPCFGRYYYRESYPMLNSQSEETELVFEFGQYLKQTEVTILAPTFSQAFRWFDENTDLMGFVVPSIKDNHFDWLIRIDWEEEIECEEAYSSRIEAELACLRKLIEIVKKIKKS